MASAKSEKTQEFWTAVATAADPASYRPQRSKQVEVARLQADGEPYFVLKQPDTRSYLRLSESDYALWWQMQGDRSLKELLFYSLRRYRTLPIGHLNGLIDDLKNGRFLTDTPTNLYTQMETALAERAPASRGRRLLDAFLHTELSVTGLDDPFTWLYRRLRGLYTFTGQLLLLLLVLVGGALFGLLFWSGTYGLVDQGGWSVFGFIVANLVVIFIHEVAHGLTVKHFGRELHKGGFLIYWGFPSFFVDTRDIWMSPRWARIAVSAAGPYSGLIVGGVIGLALTGIWQYAPAWMGSFGANFLFLAGFVAYLSVLINLNPLLELDGYFILMDWLDMPGLRERAFTFWRESFWPRLRETKTPAAFWRALHKSERIFLLFGGLAFAYSLYALWFAAYFWQSRLLPWAERLWQQGAWGRLLVLVITAVLIVPAVYYLLQFGWSRMQSVIAWLARRDLLARPDVLALLIGLPLIVGLPLLMVGLSALPRGDLFLTALTWLIHLAAIGVLAGVARQLPGSRFQWAIWSLAAAPAGLTLAWLLPNDLLWHDAALMGTAVAVLAAGIVSWYTVGPKWLSLPDRVVMGIMIVAGAVYFLIISTVVGTASLMTNGRWAATALILTGLFLGLMFMAPLLVNFSRSRFALPWLLLVLAITAVPWLQFFPYLHLPVAALWLYAGLLYLVVGELARFERIDFDVDEMAIFDERTRLANAYDAFVQALFSSYEMVFGRRRLNVIHRQMTALDAVDADDTILQMSERARQALLLAVDRLDDLAGTPFTRQAGQAAYDSLPWLYAETLARHVLAEMEWGSRLAEGFIQARDRRAELIRRADVFAGFDQEAVTATQAIARTWSGRDGVVMARAGTEATVFYLIESGEVALLHEGVQVGKLMPGGYFGVRALLDSGVYDFTYRTLTPVQALAIDRDKFDPLLRVDTTLASQVSSGARERDLLRRMPLFSSLSPQELTMIDARLTTKNVAAGEVLVRQGDPRTHLFVVVQGDVEVLVQDEAGDEQINGRLGPGEHFGEYALFADTPYQATYRAATACKLLLLDEPTFDRLVAQCERMSHYVEQIGSGRLIATRRRLGPSAILS